MNAGFTGAEQHLREGEYVVVRYILEVKRMLTPSQHHSAETVRLTTHYTCIRTRGQRSRSMKIWCNILNSKQKAATNMWAWIAPRALTTSSLLRCIVFHPSQRKLTWAISSQSLGTVIWVEQKFYLIAVSTPALGVREICTTNNLLGKNQAFMTRCFRVACSSRPTEEKCRYRFETAIHLPNHELHI